ncbi:zinc finger protein 182-like [Rhipicephalus sanguineus]|uniref:zinc finger protein 182-like n=1 Tax=Rhipicephalus sanguineus TaxID=34632 RepID=UPI0020C52AAB|nr:zinc finger protein 182-like [Rhipicephalus sanguineus]
MVPAMARVKTRTSQQTSRPVRGSPRKICDNRSQDSILTADKRSPDELRVSYTNGKRSFQCGVCDKVFSRRTHLRTHLFSHARVKRYACDVCGKKFAHNKNLVIHSRTHTGERPFECSSCPATFTSRENLRRHMMTHTGERAHECDVCGKRFAMKAKLVYHALTHSGEKAFACRIVQFCIQPWPEAKDGRRNRPPALSKDLNEQSARIGGKMPPHRQQTKGIQL